MPCATNVDAQREEVVEEIVPVGDAVEHALDLFFLASSSELT